MSKNLSKDALILQNRTAFALFLKKGIHEVERLYPSSVDFVQRNKGKTLKEVTDFLSKKLNAQSEKLIPA
jgi:hypothetical protein